MQSRRITRQMHSLPTVPALVAEQQLHTSLDAKPPCTRALYVSSTRVTNFSRLTALHRTSRFHLQTFTSTGKLRPNGILSTLRARVWMTSTL
jgi:hypothetical protein